MKMKNKQLRASIAFGFGRQNWEQAIDFVVEAH